MTKFQKQMLTIAAAGALTAVTALPAMAFESEFHGLFNFNAVFSNYNNSNSGDLSTTSTVFKQDKSKMNNYLEQRVRLMYVGKASDDLKLVTQFEIDNEWGKSTATTATSNKTNGVGLDTDVVNIEVKHAYLDFNIGKSFNTKIGMQPYKDTLKGIFLDADVPAIMTTTKIGAYTLGLGFTRYNDTNGGSKTLRVGDNNTDVFIMDNTIAFNKDTKATFSYYFDADYVTNNAKLINTFGLGGETKVGPVALSGFAAMQAGHQKNVGTGSTYYHGWAANVAAKANVGIGTARTGFLFTSGNNSNDPGSNKGWQAASNGTSATTSVQSYNESGLIILTRNTANSPTNTDQYVKRFITNVAVAYLGYDAKLTDKFNLDGGVGFAWAPSSADAPIDGKSLLPGSRNASDFIGTEIGLTAGYQLYKNLKLMAQAAYMINGGYYKNSATKADGTAADPQNPYTMRLQARYSF